MVGRYGLDYAVHIVTSHFGDLVAKVCNCLLHRGSLSLQELIRFTELFPSTVKNCLLILIQHNCVQAFSVPRPGSGGTVRAVTLYISLFDNIIHRSRLSKFVAVVREDDELVDEEGGGGGVDTTSTSKRPSSLKPVNGAKKPNLCVNLIDGLPQHGRLTFEQLFVREVSKQGMQLHGVNCAYNLTDLHVHNMWNVVQGLNRFSRTLMINQLHREDVELRHLKKLPLLNNKL